MTGSRPTPDPVRHLAAEPDPVAGFLAAHDRGQLVALRTSGTGGRSRAVVRTTRSWVASFGHVAALTGLDGTSRVWVPGPLSATMNLFAAVHARFVGASLVGPPSRVTHAQLTPSRLAQALDDGVDLGGVRVVVAGDRLPCALRDRARAAGAVVDHYYGAAELSFVGWGAGEHGLRPFPEVEVVVRDQVIWARSPFLCEGYDGPDGPLRFDAGGFASVGDRGALTGGLLRVDGRGTDTVITGGATVQVADVEQLLRGTARGDVVVVGLPHPGLGAVVAAVLTDAGDVTGLRRTARSSLDPAQRPRRWYHVADLPHTAAGKIDRAGLAALVAGPAGGRGGSVRRLG